MNLVLAISIVEENDCRVNAAYCVETLRVWRLSCLNVETHERIGYDYPLIRRIPCSDQARPVGH